MRVGGEVPLSILAVGGITALAIYCSNRTDEQQPPPLECKPSFALTAQNAPSQDLLEEGTRMNRSYHQDISSGVSNEEIFERARRLTFERAYQLARTGDLTNLEICPDGQRNIVIFGESFDMTSQSDLILGIAIVNALFERSVSDTPGERIRDVSSLMWLKQNVSLELGDYPPILSTVRLEELAQILRELNDRGRKIPERIVFGNALFDDPNTIGVHYIDFSIPWFLARHNPRLLEDIRKINPQATESYAHYLMQRYLFDGATLRRELRYQELKGSEQGFGNEYRVLKDFFGSEFIGRAFPKKVLEYQIGNIVRIKDYEYPSRPGIILRKLPNLDRNPTLPYIEHDALVRVIGMHTKIDDKAQQAFLFYEVQVGYLDTSRGDLKFIDTQGKSGFILSDWLGDKK